MKKWATVVLALLLVTVTLTGCGMKSKEDVVEALKTQAEEMKGYKVNATLTIENNEDPQNYEVEIWHNKPTLYRVSLKNAKRNQHQLILRN
ncbi:MAG: outer membrane lipoprotein carrier protein LolA, partial [Bacilli bacterium]